jgi:hypothetical protein
MTTTLKQLYEELDAFNATLNDENEDTPELLAEQERLLNAIIAAEAADLTALSAKELIAHFNKRAPGQHLPKGLAKSAIITRINALPPLAAPAAEPTPTPETFSVAGWAMTNGKDGREIRKQLRQAGKRAPYSRADVEALA